MMRLPPWGTQPFLALLCCTFACLLASSVALADDAQGMLNSAQAAYNAGDFGEARTLYQQVAEQCPTSATCGVDVDHSSGYSFAGCMSYTFWCPLLAPRREGSRAVEPGGDQGALCSGVGSDRGGIGVAMRRDGNTKLGPRVGRHI